LRLELHERITKFVAENLGLSKDVVEEIVRACLDVDRLHRIERVKHHEVPKELLLNYAVKARKRYMKGDLRAAARLCGELLHYIQDSLIPAPRGRRGKALHISIESRSVKYDPESIPREMLKPVRGLRGIKAILRVLRPLRDPRLVVERATLYSYAIAAAVFDSIEAPPEVDACASLAREYLSSAWRREVAVSMLLLSVLQTIFFARSMLLKPLILLCIAMLIGFAVFVLARLSIAMYARKCDTFVKNFSGSRFLVLTYMLINLLLYFVVGLKIVAILAPIAISLTILLRVPGARMIEENRWWYRYECRAPPHLCAY